MAIIVRANLRTTMWLKNCLAIVCGMLIVTPQASFPQDRSSDTDINRRVDSLLHLMTLEEKCGQLNQIPSPLKPHENDMDDDNKDLFRRGLVGSVLNVVGVSSVRAIQGFAVEESRLHIPIIIGVDVIHGARTVFPVPLAQASSWDPDLVEEESRVAAREASAEGIHWTFAPMVDIARDPRWGRIVEGSGEDPYLGSVMAAAKVRGFQGTNLADPTSILACAKHFAAYGGAEGGRDYNTVDISERTLRDIYLPPYKAAVDAGAGSVMTSFNEIGGVPSTASKFLMTDILRGEWGFDGFVVTDWTAMGELLPHGVAATRAGAATEALQAGVDLDMVSKIYVDELPKLVRSGKVTEARVDEAVRHVLRMKFMLGLFADPYRGASAERENQEILSRRNLETARLAAQRSIVLLRNENSLLPLPHAIKTLAVIGPLADDKHDPLGPWAAGGKDHDVVSVLEGLTKKVPQAKLLHVRGCEIESDSGYHADEAVKAAKQADVVILVLGEALEMSGEAASRSDLNLPGRQEDLVKAVVETGTPVVLVLMNGRPLTISWEAEHVPAIIESWFLGVQTGNAVADVLFGDVNPSGKLPVTFPRSVGQIPIYYDHKNTGRPFASYDKYTSKYIDIDHTPLYPFGYGLSYTAFSYSNLTDDRGRAGLQDSVIVSALVKNTGTREGDEVVQLYVRDLVASVTRPVKELKGFQRIALKPGEEKSVRFAVRISDLSFYNLEMHHVVEPGVFKVYIGGNSVDVIEGQFEVVAH